MRDIARIDRTCDTLKELWHKYPDMRLWQLLLNIDWGYRGDFFFLEDDKALAAIEKVLKEGF